MKREMIEGAMSEVNGDLGTEGKGLVEVEG